VTDGRMTLAQYLARRAAAQVPERRPTCERCRKALTTCYCHLLRPYAAPIEFVILQHPGEARNPIATARMAHLSMTNSRMIVGYHFDGNAQVESLLRAPERRNVMLYPRPDAEPLDDVLSEALAPSAEPLVLWVLDAKWSHVAKMMRLSPSVKALPATAFAPQAPSRFCVRTQPDRTCLSTVEAIHAVLARRAQLAGDGDTRHEGMIEVFRHLVSQQLGFCDRDDDMRHASAKRLRRERRARKEGRAI
jgi:DTW domain-containing protein YfiP